MSLNERIAKSKGWTTKELFGFGGTYVAYLDPEGKGHSNFPDVEHDPRLYMQLFEEMAQSGASPSLFCNEFPTKMFGLGWLDLDKHHECKIANTIGSAICEAYCKLKGLGEG